MVFLDERPAISDPPIDGADALFKEARRRTRRRRASRLAFLGLIVAGAVLTYAFVLAAPPRSADSATPAPAVDRTGFAGHGDLAFVSKGRLWLLNGGTGALAALTRRSQQASSPGFSPDGRWLTYAVTIGGAAGSGQTWIARSDGGTPRRVGGGSGATGWLPDGRLVAASAIWSITPDGVARQVGSAPAGLVAWSPTGDRFVFVSGGLAKPPPQASRGVYRLQVSASLNGSRRTWFETHISFARKSGWQGASLDNVIVLPRHAGILFEEGPGPAESARADGLDLFAINAAGTRPRNLGLTVTEDVSAGANGVFAFTRGGNRYAWVTKAVAICSATAAGCAGIATAARTLSLDPAFAPDGRTLAFVEAARGHQGNIGQSALRRWYATHSLWLAHPGSATPAKIAGTTGAAAPVWSTDGRSLLYVADDALWLLPTLASRPVRIASPLFSPNDWQSFYGQVSWSGQFAWSSGTPR